MQRQTFRMGIGQIPSVQADIDHNLRLIEQMVADAQEQGVSMLAFPELALTGYVVDARFSDLATMIDSERMDHLRELSLKVDLIIGFIEETRTSLFHNSVVHLSQGEILHVHRKIYLPTYRMFDERRYFGAGWSVAPYDTEYIRTAMLICGDAWHLPLPYLAAQAGADLLIIAAASSREGLADTTPCPEAWRSMCSSYALTLSTFVVFANLANADGNDSGHTFWGGSFVAGPDGRFLTESQVRTQDLVVCDLDPNALREQRIKLPFRRDDSLSHTLTLGRRILNSKITDDYGPSPAREANGVQKPR